MEYNYIYVFRSYLHIRRYYYIIYYAQITLAADEFNILQYNIRGNSTGNLIHDDARAISKAARSHTTTRVVFARTHTRTPR